MKVSPWLFPIFALIAVSGWIVFQKHSVQALEREIEMIHARITQVKTGVDEKHETDAGHPKDKDGKIDWKEMAGKVSMMGNGAMYDIRTMMRIQRMLMEMSPDKLAAQLDEIAALDLEDAARKQLENMILGILSDKEPRLVLERFGDKFLGDDSGQAWLLGSALRRWAEEEPAAACAWMDKRIADGGLESKALDGRNSKLLSMEGMLASSLLKTDPATAAARVMRLPEEQRMELFRQGFYFQIDAQNEAAFVGLVRTSLASDKVAEVLADKAENLVARGGYERVDGFIASAKATDAEKAAIVEKAFVSKVQSKGQAAIQTGDLDKAREWAATHVPGAVDQLTGKVLAESVLRGGDSGRIAEMVLGYNERSKNDEVLLGFLRDEKSRDLRNEELEILLAKIKDSTVREEIRNQRKPAK